ncbi:TPA: hypothetical protein HA251_06275 [Candidatus Woesearchaeota archaeon]|nr:hypothetical protein [Candidatus Woesearchaeota archaeon]
MRIKQHLPSRQKSKADLWREAGFETVIRGTSSIMLWPHEAAKMHREEKYWSMRKRQFACAGLAAICLIGGASYALKEQPEYGKAAIAAVATGGLSAGAKYYSNRQKEYDW